MAVLYGFHSLEDAFDQSAMENLADVTDAITAAQAEYNAVTNSMVSIFAQRTTDYGAAVKVGGGRRLQPQDEFARALATRRKPASFRVEWPLQSAGDAIAQTYEASVAMTVEQVNDNLEEMQQADSQWVREHLLGGLFTNVSWDFDDDQYGPLTIYGLANGDTHTYTVDAAGLSQEIDNHYFAQSAAIDDLNNPYPGLREALEHHPVNAGSDVVAFIHSDQRGATEALAGFFAYSDPNISPAPGEPQLVGSAPGGLPGKIIGYVDGVWIAVWGGMPSGYILVTTQSQAKPLAMREWSFAQLRGFVLDAEEERYPYLQRQYKRRAGFGARNRIGAAVTQIGSGTYAAPAGLSAPMP
jgi:hypothetical protein